MWLSGFSLSQTLFTFLPMHNAKSIPNDYLKNFCVTLLKHVTFYRTFIYRCDVYEEEDFMSNAHGLNLCHEVTDVAFLTDLKTIEKQIVQSLQDTKNSESSSSSQNPPEPQLTNDQANNPLFDLLCRFRFLRAIYQLNLQLNNLSSNYNQALEGAKKAHKLATDQFAKIRKSSVGKEFIPKFYFDPKACRRMPNPIPPREVEVLSLDSALKFWEKHFSDTLYLFDLPTVYKTSLWKLQHFVLLFSDLNPDIICRSRLKFLLFPGISLEPVFNKPFNGIPPNQNQSTSNPPSTNNDNNNNTNTKPDSNPTDNNTDSNTTPTQSEEPKSEPSPNSDNTNTTNNTNTEQNTTNNNDNNSQNDSTVPMKEKPNPNEEIYKLLVQSMKDVPVPVQFEQFPEVREHLLWRMANAISNRLKILCYNQARQKRFFVKSLEEWAIIQREAEHLDRNFEKRLTRVPKNPPPVQTAAGRGGGRGRGKKQTIKSRKEQKEKQKQEEEEEWLFFLLRWAMYMTFPNMVTYLTRGFDLQIYSEAEYTMVYWYLDVILGMQSKTRLDLYQKVPLIEPPSAGFVYTNPENTIEQLIVEANLYTVRGIFKYTMALLQYCNKKDVIYKEGMERRFCLRFGPFRKLPQPQCLVWKNFEGTDVYWKSENYKIFKLALSDLDEAKTRLEKLAKSKEGRLIEEEAKKMYMVVLSNIVKASSLVKEMDQIKMGVTKQQPGTKKHSSTTPAKKISYDFTKHSSYPILSLVDIPNSK